MSNSIIKRYWQQNWIIIIFFFCFILQGCGMVSIDESPIASTSQRANPDLHKKQTENSAIFTICQPLFEKFCHASKPMDIEKVRKIVSIMGSYGYAAIDTCNQINMTKSEQVLEFYESVIEAQKDSLTVIVVGYTGEFFLYNLETKDGKMDINKGLYRYDKGTIQTLSMYDYQANWMKYTQDGYFLFSGIAYTQELYVLSLSGVEEYTAFRVQPLEERCRELNRQYLLPIGYEQNNLFLTDWNEKDYGSLDFYDAFDRFYPLVNGQENPYVMAEDLGLGAVYRIPKKEFEQVIRTYLQIDRQTLQSETMYHAEDETYEYKPRGFYEIEYPSYPYPEVTAFTEHNDGTITMEVHAVFPDKGLSKVFSHEVVVRPLENGGVQYLSNQVLTWENGYESIWYTPRLTAEEWEENYGKAE